MKEITLYRVRKNFGNIKSQKGAYFTFYTAVRVAQKYGLNVYDNEGKLLYKGNSPLISGERRIFRNLIDLLIGFFKKTFKH